MPKTQTLAYSFLEKLLGINRFAAPGEMTPAGDRGASSQ